jgi:hypothetical protein
MTEMVLSIAASLVVLVGAIYRLNVIKYAHLRLSLDGMFNTLEALGLAAIAGGCAGEIGEWFLPRAEIHAETIVLTGLAIFVVGVSRGRVCQMVVRMQGWDGTDRRWRHP